MTRTNFTTAAIAIVAIATVAWTTYAQEAERKADALRQEIRELAEAGRHEEASELERHLVEVLREIERTKRKDVSGEERELQEWRHSLMQELKEMREHAGEPEQVARLEAELDRATAQLHRLLAERERHEHDRNARAAREREHAAGFARAEEVRGVHREHRREGHQEPGQRLEHMHAAIEHLRAAGLHEMAEHVADHARELEHEMRGHSEDHALRMLEHIAENVAELREEVAKLREGLEELHEAIEE